MNLQLTGQGFDAAEFAGLRGALERRLQERGCHLGAGYDICVAQDAAMRPDEYALQGGETGALVRAGGISGAYAGLGRLLRLSRFDGRGGFLPFVGERGLRPQNAIHGMYFASHFGNFYEAAPPREVENLIEDLALRGCNALMVWYDMHQYAGVDDPASMKMIARLKRLLQCARRAGMQTVFGTLANEAFAASPAAMRAEWRAQNGYFREPGGHYHVEICPNKPGGLAEILRQRREVLGAFVDAPIDFVSIWPYDQGGCTCEKCAPWGANGFLKTASALAGLYREALPGAKILLSTWYFDRFIAGEWAAFK